MVEEMIALDDNGTWAPRSAGIKAIGCKLLFAIKVYANGTVAWLKAHLVAKVYAQIYETDYVNTISPFAKLTSIQLFLSMVVTH